jgi:hypothetical protein
MTTVSWANMPIFILATVGGGAMAVARLVAVRTPVSAFNVILEFVEVHTRKYSFSAVWHNWKVTLVAGALVFWAGTSFALYWWAPRILGLVSTNAYVGSSLELVLFWVLQLAILVDKITFNEQRRVAPRTISVTGSLRLAMLCSVVAYPIITLGATAGAIVSMILWCCANVVVRKASAVGNVQPAL